MGHRRLSRETINDPFILSAGRSGTDDGDLFQVWIMAFFVGRLVGGRDLLACHCAGSDVAEVLGIHFLEPAYLMCPIRIPHGHQKT
jgi:hypothetical protein